MKKVILYIAKSLDGFIARSNGSVDWLDQFTTEDYGYYKFYRPIKNILMGSTTYKQVLTFGDFPYKGKKSFVFSRASKGKDDNVTYFKGRAETLLKKLDGKTWLVGGANIVNQFIKKNLIDEYIIFTMPIILGKGIRLFDDSNKELNLKLKSSKSYKSGVIEMHYKRA